MHGFWHLLSSFLRRLRRSTAAAAAASCDSSSVQPVAFVARSAGITAGLIDVKGTDGVVLLHLAANTEPPRVWASMPTVQARALCWELWRACKESELPAQVA